MSFQRNNMYYHETDEIQQILDNFRELIHGYNENMRYHYRALESYQQNINQSIGLLQIILNRIISSSRNYQNDVREPRTTNNQFRNRPTPQTPNPNPNPNPNINGNSLEMDISSLIYLFMTPPSTQHRNTENRHLTPTQIENSLEMIVYNSATIEERHCPISLDDFIENEEICRIRGCGHIFRRQPLMIWLETHVGCPVCRYNLHDFSNNIIPTSLSFDENTSTNSVSDTESYTLRNNIPLSPSFLHRNNITRETRSRTFPSSEPPSTYLPRTRTDNANTYTLQLPLEIISNHLEDRISAGRPLYNPNFSYREDNIQDLSGYEESTHHISQMIANVIRHQIPTTDISNNL
jgi:hypothetical protein